MRVCFRQINKLYDLNQIEVLKDFTEFLHSQMELNNDIVINNTTDKYSIIDNIHIELFLNLKKYNNILKNKFSINILSTDN